METKTKQYLIVTVTGVSLFAALTNLPTVLKFAGQFIDIILPIIAGGILALFISVPMEGIKKRLYLLFDERKNRPSDKAIHVMSFLITFLCIILVLSLFLTLLIPEIIRSSQSLYRQIEDNIPQWLNYLQTHDEHIGWLEKWLSEINWNQIMKNMSIGSNKFLSNVAGALSSTISVVITAAFSIIISIYISLGKEKICHSAHRCIRAYLKPGWAEYILHFCQLFRRSFANFLTGQCMEAVILGTLMFFAFTIFRLPYGILAGALTAICAIIPYVGAFISCSVSVILVLLVSPRLAIRCLIVYLVVQFIENQFIYPRVVGSSVGLSPFYTLIAAMIGGKLFGIIGIIFFIPLTAVIIDLIEEDVERKLKRNKINL